MIAKLQSVIAPLTETEFLTYLYERTPAFVRTSEPSRFESLLNWDELNHLVESGMYPIEALRVRNSMVVPTGIYIKQGRLDPAALSSLMDQGVDLIFNRLDRYVPRLGRLCHQIGERIGEHVTADAVVTTAKDGTAQHVNAEDVCILQIAGSKRCELYPQDVSAAEDASVRAAGKGVRVFDEMLTAGDFLFVPGEHVGRFENGPGCSLQVRIALEPPSSRDVLTSIASRLETDETFNQPLTRYDDAGALAAHEAVLKARLIDQVQAWSLAGFLADRAAARSKTVRIHIQGPQTPAEEPKA
jgi:ribosomal protein L16 Arg81 hydroxylase